MGRVELAYSFDLRLSTLTSKERHNVVNDLISFAEDCKRVYTLMNRFYKNLPIKPSVSVSNVNDTIKFLEEARTDLIETVDKTIGNSEFREYNIIGRTFSMNDIFKGMVSIVGEVIDLESSMRSTNKMDIFCDTEFPSASIDLNINNLIIKMKSLEALISHTSAKLDNAFSNEEDCDRYFNEYSDVLSAYMSNTSITGFRIRMFELLTSVKALYCAIVKCTSDAMLFAIE